MQIYGGGVKIILTNNTTISIEKIRSYKELKDYKFFCFNGNVKFFKIDYGRFTEHHANYYSTKGELLPFGEKDYSPNPNHIEIIPNNLNEMIQIAERLSCATRFLRVDLYNVNGTVYFGELTFYPASGFGEFSPEGWNEKLGDLITI